ncbi:MAG: putative Ig domain-containing protein, partial [Bryobacteraceae bacterium]
PGTQGTGYATTLSVLNGVPSYFWSIVQGTPPPGISLGAPSGSSVPFTGTPTQAGVFNFTVQVSDGQERSTTKAFTITIQTPGPTITTVSPLTPATLGVVYTTNFAASNGAAPFSWSVVSGTLPAGLVLSGPTLSGTPTQAGTFSFTVQAIDANQAPTTKLFSLTVQAQSLFITAPSQLPAGTVGVFYSTNFTASGGTPPYIWQITGGQTPPGLSSNAAGVLSGTPSQAGSFPFTLQVTDSAQKTAAQVISINIQGAASLIIASTPSPLPNGTVGTPYSASFSASGGTSPYTWALVTGSLPTGLSFSPAGAITGTPTGTGTFTASIQVNDSAQRTAAQTVTITVQPASAVSITTAPALPGGTVGAAYTLTLSATGGVAPYFWSFLSGTLPAGLSVTQGGSLSGTPTQPGSFTFAIQTQDSRQTTASATFSLTIAASQSIVPSFDSLTFTGFDNGDAPAPQHLSLTASAAQSLQYTIVVDAGTPGSPAPPWIKVGNLKGSLPARLPITVDQRGLTAGRYTARAIITSSDLRQTIINVTFTVESRPQQLEVAPESLRFSGTAVSLSPGEQTLLVRNAGGGGPVN